MVGVAMSNVDVGKNPLMTLHWILKIACTDVESDVKYT